MKKLFLAVVAVVTFTPVVSVGEIYSCSEGGQTIFRDEPCGGQQKLPKKAPVRSNRNPLQMTTASYDLSCYFVVPLRPRVSFMLNVDEDSNTVVMDGETAYPAEISGSAIKFTTNPGPSKRASWFINRMTGELRILNAGSSIPTSGGCQKVVGRKF